YAMDMVGNEKSLKKIKKKTLSDLHNERLSKSSIIITYCGSDEMEDVIDKLEPLFDGLNPRAEKVENKNQIDPQYGRDIQVDFDREQTHIFIGRPAFKVGTTEDLYLKMLTSYL